MKLGVEGKQRLHKVILLGMGGATGLDLEKCPAMAGTGMLIFVAVHAVGEPMRRQDGSANPWGLALQIIHFLEKLLG